MALSKTQEREQTEFSDRPQPISGRLGVHIIGPTNPTREAENPDTLAPPRVDHGTMANLRWSFADSHMHLSEGGWGRQTTVRELPIATEVAGVNMRLTPGGVREMHWHKAAEWAYMLKGRARITAIDQDGRTFQDDVGEGDLWYFPAGIPHSIQGLEDDGCEFLLVFDDGNFSEEETFLLSDWLAHTPKEVLAKNFGVPESASIASRRRTSGSSRRRLSPFGPLAAIASSGTGRLNAFSHRMLAQKPDPHEEWRHGPQTSPECIFAQGGEDDRGGLGLDRGLGRVCANCTRAPECGRVAVLHLRPGADDRVRVAEQCTHLQLPGRRRRRRAVSHGSQSRTRHDDAAISEIFRSDYYADVSLAQWLAFTPHELVRAHLNIDEAAPGRKS